MIFYTIKGSHAVPVDIGSAFSESGGHTGGALAGIGSPAITPLAPGPAKSC